MFDGRTIADAPNFGNWSYFDSPKYNRLLEEASRLTGAKRDQAYRELDVMLSRDAAPAIPFAALNAWAFVSARVGCVVMNPQPRPDRGLPQVTRALAATLFAALVLVPAAGTQGIKEGGTFRVGIPASTIIDSIDPILARFPGANPVIDVTCGGLLTFPALPLPEACGSCPRSRTATRRSRTAARRTRSRSGKGSASRPGRR